MGKVGAGGAASIWARRAKAYKAQLDTIEEALDRMKITAVEDSTAPTADRVVLALMELRELRKRVDDLEWEAAGAVRQDA